MMRIYIDGIYRDMTPEEEAEHNAHRHSPSTVEQIAELKQVLADTDYKVIKCYEYSLAGLEVPYDVQALHNERQAMRDKIAELEQA